MGHRIDVDGINVIPSVTLRVTLVKVVKQDTVAIVVRLGPAVFLPFLVLVTGFEGITLTIRGSTDSTKRFRRASGKTVPLAECSSWTASIQKNRFARILVIVVGRTSISTEP